MIRYFWLMTIACLGLLSSHANAVDGGFKGGARKPGGGGAAARPSGMQHMGGSARASMPTQQRRPSTPATRPSAPATRPSVTRPSTSQPSVTRPNVTRPSTTRPSTTRPSIGQTNPPTTRPAMPSGRPNAPQVTPGGGFKPKPSTRPSLPTTGDRPTTRPSNPLDNRPSIDRPNIGRPKPQLPGFDPARPGRPSTLPETLPSTRPNLPNLGGGNRPTTLPDRLPGGGNRPTTLPDRLPGGGNRPTTLPGNLPGGGNRPSPGDLGDFLGIGDGIRPAPGRPGLGNLPTQRPDVSRPVTLPARRPIDLDRPIAARPGANQRPINIGSINVGNTTINNRLSWANIDNSRVTAIHNSWGNQINSLHGWAGSHPARLAYWGGWAGGVRSHWGMYHHHGNWFAGNWWNSHPSGMCRWHYYHRFNDYPWGYWWRRPAWGVTASWFAWSAASPAWSQPIYYDYGSGGNVTYENNYVYINGEQVATAEEFAQSAAVLATVDPPATEEDAATAEWLPLGTFALSTGESDVEPQRVVQLAVDKLGNIAGTLYNYQTDQAIAIQGRVDKETQRVALRLGESETTVAETGIYNLTQDEVPLLVHFGTDRVENYILVRLEEPGDDGSTAP